VDVPLACASLSRARELPGIGWEAAHDIMRRAVGRYQGRHVATVTCGSSGAAPYCSSGRLSRWQDVQYFSIRITNKSLAFFNGRLTAKRRRSEMNSNITSPVSQEMDQIGRQVIASLYEALIADGHIHPEGKSEDQIIAEVRKAARKWSNRRPMLVGVDFRSDLLTQARRLRRRGKLHEAILYYATWFEHWINRVLTRNLRSLNDREARQMLRDVSLRGKFTWLLGLVHGKQIPERHIRAILRVSDVRNEFVHYKYKLVDVDAWTDEDEPLRLQQQKAQAAVRYLTEFELRHFFHVPSLDLLRRLRNTGNERTKPKRRAAPRSGLGMS